MDIYNNKIYLNIMGQLQDNFSMWGYDLAYLANYVKENANQVDDSIQHDELSPALAKLDDGKEEMQDPLKEANLEGEGADSPKITFISQLLP